MKFEIDPLAIFDKARLNYVVQIAGNKNGKQYNIEGHVQITNGSLLRYIIGHWKNPRYE